MLDVSVASIIVAAISLISVLAAAAFAAYTSRRADKRKREDESINIVKKYHDPLLIAAVTLRHKLFQFRNTRNTRNTHSIPAAQTYESKGTRPKPTADYPLMYTAFLIGQYFASVHILRMESQFLSMQRTPKTKLLMGAYLEIESAWSDADQQPHDADPHDDPDPQDDPSRDCLALWRGQQSAIGELMTDTETRSCIGYAKFRDFWYTKEEFKDWFGKGFTGTSFRNKFESDRLERVIGGLDAVIKILDPENLYHDAYEPTHTPAQSDQKGGATSGHGVAHPLKATRREGFMMRT